MNLQDAMALIKHSALIENANARWADLGCGSGHFTFALANLLPAGSSILAIDKTNTSLQKLPNPHHITIRLTQMDFTKPPLPVDGLTGILMANSLHYVRNKIDFIDGAGKQLSSDGAFLVVEYDTDLANPWVPYPVSCASLKVLFKKAGYYSFTKINETPSSYHNGNLYAALIKQH